MKVVSNPENITGRAQELLARWGDADTSRVAIEEPNAKVALQPLDPLGEWRLGHSQVLGGVTEVPGVGHRGEEAEVSQQVHRNRI